MRQSRSKVLVRRRYLRVLVFAFHVNTAFQKIKTIYSRGFELWLRNREFSVK